MASWRAFTEVVAAFCEDSRVVILKTARVFATIIGVVRSDGVSLLVAELQRLMYWFFCVVEPRC